MVISATEKLPKVLSGGWVWLCGDNNRNEVANRKGIEVVFQRDKGLKLGNVNGEKETDLPYIHKVYSVGFGK